MTEDESGTTPTGLPQPGDTLPGTIDLGAFSISLAVADLEASQAFYEKLGFATVGGDAEQDWLILKNRETTIGLFHGMFEKNIITFNPGLDNRMGQPDEFTDVREIQATIEAAGLELDTRVDPDTTGAASITLVDPDGNPILIDQFM